MNVNYFNLIVSTFLVLISTLCLKRIIFTIEKTNKQNKKYTPRILFLIDKREKTHKQESKKK